MLAKLFIFLALPVTTALHDYISHEAGDLSFKKGDRITIIQKINEDWLEGELNGQKGMLPSAYVEHVEVSGSTQHHNGKASDPPLLSSFLNTYLLLPSPIPFSIFICFFSLPSLIFLPFTSPSYSFIFLLLGKFLKYISNLLLFLVSQSQVINSNHRNTYCQREKPCMTSMQNLIVNSHSRYVQNKTQILRQNYFSKAKYNKISWFICE